LVADETSLSSAPVENNDVLLMVRKAPESATARTPEGLRNDPHAPHNRENGMRGRGSGLRSIEEVMGRAVGGGGGEAVFQRLNIPGLPAGRGGCRRDDQHDDATEREDVRKHGV
jgi:hypothetical protein